MKQLRDYQRAAVAAALREWDEKQTTLVVLPTGCHDPEQGILMADGTVRKAQDIRYGMSLMGMDGTPRKVLKVHCGRSEMVKVTPVKGEPFIVTLDHKLTLVRTNEKGAPKYPSQMKGGEIVDVPVNEWLQWPKSKKHIYKLFRVGVDFESGTYPYNPASYPDPYLIGALLGDGSITGDLGFTNADPEVVRMVGISLHRHGLFLMKATRQNAGKAIEYRLRPMEQGNDSMWVFRMWLSLLGINKLRGDGKFIPKFYKLGSRHTRLQVLAGLLDTDGSLTVGGYDYVSKSPRLAADVAFVARSLGLAAYVQPCRKASQHGTVGDYYRVSISGDCAIIPCYIPRKQCGPRRQKKDVLRTGFTVEPVGKGKYVGFTVDGDNRYLMGDFTVTHNCGKTLVAAEIARHFHPRRILFLGHREELIFQGARSIFEHTGLDTQIEMADMYADSTLFGAGQVIVSTIQTQVAGKGDGRMTRFDPFEFGLVVVDEAHHVTAGSYRRVLDHYKQNPELKILCLTATPDRADEEALGQVIDSVAFDYEILDAIADGYLVPVEQQMVTIQGLDFSHVRTTAGDLNGADLAAVMEAEKNLHGVASATLDIIGERKAIVFAVTVKQAETYAEIFNRHRPGSAAWVCGKTPKPERHEIFRKFAGAETQILVNVGITTEGYDNPAVEVIVQARPTKSRCLYSQMVGRGTRTLPGTIDGIHSAEERRAAIDASAKPSCLVIDFAGNAGRHKLVTTADILGGRVSEAARQLALKSADGKPVRMSEELAAAEEELLRRAQEEEERRREAARRAHLTASATYRTAAVDPFDLFQMTPAATSRAWNRNQRLSDKQRAILQRQGIDPDSLPFPQAKQVLNALFERWDKKLCTLKQAKVLRPRGYDTAELSAADASKLIDEIAGREGWRQRA